MCESCFDAFAKMKDIERPCRKAGCKRTWTDKRGAQLARLVRGRTGDPYPQYCTECQKELGDLEDREVTCKTDGCTGTWTWTREQQLAAGVRPMPRAEAELEAGPATAEVAGEAAATAAVPLIAAVETIDATATSTETPVVTAAEASAPATEQPATEVAASGTVVGAPQAAQNDRGRRGGRGGRNRRGRKQRVIQPPERLCHACAEFLKDKKTLEIPCQQCATPIYWPPESQLQTHLGNWATPAMCGACKRDATEAARRAAKEAIRHQIEHGHTPGSEPAGEEAISEGQVATEASGESAAEPVATAEPVHPAEPDGQRTN
jgi:hypothetical protein